MTYEAKIIEDSIAKGVRLTTFSITFPRFILAEFNTHRMLSRNSASSRAIPVMKRVRAVWAAPFIPEAFASNKAGMQAGEEVSPFKAMVAWHLWWLAAKVACMFAWCFAKLEVHKQWANRIIETFAWHQVVCTATDWENFFALRVSKLAQPEIFKIAKMMEELYNASTPKELKEGEWHLPYVLESERRINLSPDALEPDSDAPAVEGMYRPMRYTASARERMAAAVRELVKFSAARCARTSYETHETGKVDQKRDVELYDKLTSSRHMSPHEHPARVGTEEEIAGREYIGNFRAPWIQHRKDIVGEAVAPRETET
jgi:thymidylate synthase ThyX